jgi:hypothetical protein
MGNGGNVSKAEMKDWRGMGCNFLQAVSSICVVFVPLGAPSSGLNPAYFPKSKSIILPFTVDDSEGASLIYTYNIIMIRILYK